MLLVHLGSSLFSFGHDKKVSLMGKLTYTKVGMILEEMYRDRDEGFWLSCLYVYRGVREKRKYFSKILTALFQFHRKGIQRVFFNLVTVCSSFASPFLPCRADC